MLWNKDLLPSQPAYRIAASQAQHMRVIAGPGTGKSFAIKRRITRLLERGIAPKQILPVTFTRVAAKALHDDLVGMAAPRCEYLQSTTLHSLAFRILSRNRVVQDSGRVARPLLALDREPLVHDLKSMFGGIRNVNKNIAAFEAAWARLQHEVPGYTKSASDLAFEKALSSWLLFHRAMLIGEVIPHLYQYLKNNPSAEEYREYSHVLVDEYQDLNRVEQSVIDLLATNSSICIVGDDDQSIYTFKHAHPEGIREWINDRANSDDLSVGECWRCPGRVVDMANHLIAQNVNRIPRPPLAKKIENGPGSVRIVQYETLEQEIIGIARIVKNAVDSGTSPGDILVLTQARILGNPMADQLRNNGIAAHSLYAESELKSQDLQKKMCLLRLAVTQEDRVALRWLLGLGLPEWGRRPYARLRAHCEARRESPWSVLGRMESQEVQIVRTDALVERYMEIKTDLQKMQAVADLTGLVDHLFPESDCGAVDLRNLAIQVLETAAVSDGEGFLRELERRLASPEGREESDSVKIMSLHKSKGLSAPVTIICGCVNGLLPRRFDPKKTVLNEQEHLEEQRRLFYVGLTRVRADPKRQQPGTLVLTYSQRLSTQQAYSSNIEPVRRAFGLAWVHASRFIGELGPSAPAPVSG